MSYHALLHHVQVAYHCVEHGRVLDNLRDRYAELANALYLSINHSSQQHIAVSGALSAAVAAATAAQATARTLQQQLAAKEAQAEHLQTELTTLRLKHDQLESESRGDIQQLNHQVLGLRQQLWQLRDEGEAQQSAAESAAAAAREEAERKLAAAEETNQNLMQRLSFLNAQMLALRWVVICQSPDFAEASGWTVGEQWSCDDTTRLGAQCSWMHLSCL